MPFGMGVLKHPGKTSQASIDLGGNQFAIPIPFLIPVYHADGSLYAWASEATLGKASIGRTGCACGAAAQRLRQSSDPFHAAR